MNKKTILSVVLLSSMFLVSCGKTAEMGSFEDEMKAEQNRYAENVSKYIAQSEEFSEGKFTSNGDYTFSISNDNLGEGVLALGYDANIIMEEENVGFAGTLNLDISGGVNKDDKLKKMEEFYEELKEYAGAGFKVNLSTKLGFADKNLYFSLDDLKVNIDNPNNLEVLNSIEMIKFETIAEKLGKKWLKQDLSEFIQEDAFKQLITVNKEYIANLKDLTNFMFTGDIFESDGVLTKYEGKDAYKFTIDDAKFKAHLVETFKRINLLANTYSDKELEELVKQIEADLDTIAIKESEGYLVRSSGDDVNLIIKNITIGEKNGASDNDLEGSEDEGIVNISLEILANEVKFTLKPVIKGDETGDFTLDGSLVSEKSGNVKYNMNLVVKEGENKEDSITYTIDGNFNSKASGKSLASEFNMNMLLKDNSQKTSLNEFKIKFAAKGETKKDESVVIDEKAVLGESEAMTFEEYSKLVTDVLSPFYEGLGLNNNYDNYDYDYEYNYDQDYGLNLDEIEPINGEDLDDTFELVDENVEVLEDTGVEADLTNEENVEIVE